MAKTDFPHGANEEKPEWLVSQWMKAKTLLEEQEAKVAESRKELEALAEKVKASPLRELLSVAVPADPPKLPKRGGRPKGSKNKKARAAKKTASGRTQRGELPERLAAIIKKDGPIKVKDLADKAGTNASGISNAAMRKKLKALGVKSKKEGTAVLLSM